MAIKVIVAGATGWTGSLVCKALLSSTEFELVGAIARKNAGSDIGTALGANPSGVTITATLEDALAGGEKPDVLIDYTKPDSVKTRALTALKHGMHVVIGTSGLSAADFTDIAAAAEKAGRGVIAAGNFSITAALAKHMTLLAAQYLPSWELVDYASASKVDAPSGTVRELAEALGELKENHIALPVEKTVGYKEARGATIGKTQVHSVRLPGYVIAFESLFGLPHERLTIRHDAGTGAEPYVHGTLLAVRKVMETKGLVRGLDTLLFSK